MGTDFFEKSYILGLMTKKELNSAKAKFGENLRKIRESKGLSLRDLSINCSIGHARIQEIEKGLRDVRLGTILELAKGLEIPPSKLLDF